MATRPLLERIMAKVDKTSSPDGCWLWTGAKNGGYGGGYGVVFIEEKVVDGVRRQVFDRVHIVVYRLMVGPIPEGHVVDHVWTRGCRNRNCCNPDHLEPVTVVVNTQRGRDKNEAYCRNWHERTDENTEKLPSGWLRCLTCREESRTRQRERARERRRIAREERSAQAPIRRAA